MAADYKYGFDGMSREAMLEKMQRGWRSLETPCGSGSQIKNTELVREFLRGFMADKRSLNDAGAGDMRWIRLIEWLNPIEYRPFDLVPRHKSVTRMDVTSEVMPKADVILCRCVLNHLSPKLAMDAIKNFKASGSIYLVMTNTQAQQKYWEDVGIVCPQPLETWRDTQKWQLEVYSLTAEWTMPYGPLCPTSEDEESASRQAGT